MTPKPEIEEQHSPASVLFVCVGNACRSQMAEAFARAYGSDVMEAASAGLSPAGTVPPDTIRAMDEKNIDIRGQFPKSLIYLPSQKFDLIVNMSGRTLPGGSTAVRVWKVPDPILMDYEKHCEVRDQVESLVMGLILEFRRARKRAHR